jgi:hypothetical protein
VGAAAAALLLAGCGIPSTGVVEAGEPGAGLQPTTLLYFVRDGVLFPVARPVPGPVTAEGAVALLYKGPDVRDRLMGLISDLPPPTALPSVHTSGSDVTLTLPAGTTLARIAVDQLICTAAAAHAAEIPETALPAPATLTTPHGTHAEGSADTCPALPETTPGFPRPLDTATAQPDLSKR